MSLWPVPEIEGKETMSLFYEKWLSDEDKHDALREAELAERTTVARRWGLDRPDLWGAFVLVGR